MGCGNNQDTVFDSKSLPSRDEEIPWLLMCTSHRIHPIRDVSEIVQKSHCRRHNLSKQFIAGERRFNPQSLELKALRIEALFTVHPLVVRSFQSNLTSTSHIGCYFDPVHLTAK